MGYKLLGYVVWHGGRWYVRRRLPVVPARVAIATAASGLVVAGGLAVAQRRGAD